MPYNIVLQLFNLGDFARINKSILKTINNKIIHEPCVDHEGASEHDIGVILSMITLIGSPRGVSYVPTTSYVNEFTVHSDHPPE